MPRGYLAFYQRVSKIERWTDFIRLCARNSEPMGYILHKVMWVCTNSIVCGWKELGGWVPPFHTIK